MTTTTTVSNGTTTQQVDTTNMNIATYNVQLDYNGNNNYAPQNAQTTLQIKDGNVHSIGLGADNPWTFDLIGRGDIYNGEVTVNYARTPTIIQIPFTGDFSITLYMKMDVLQSYGNFGLTTSNTQVNGEIRIYQTSINNNTTIPSVFTQVNKIETMTITRVGNTYTYTQNGNTYTATVTNPGTVYFYVQKNGSGTIFISKMEYQNL